MKIASGATVEFARPWLRRNRERWEDLTGRPFPLTEQDRGKVDWVATTSCGTLFTGHAEKVRVGVVWTDPEGHSWFNVLPISAVKVVRDAA
jgi:hypothetical protein